MRMIGQVMGARVTTATRRSMILSSEGMELLLTFWTAPSRSSSDRRRVAPSPAAAAPSLLKKDRRPTRSCTARFMLPPFLAQPAGQRTGPPAFVLQGLDGLARLG